jgi:hypothetical protein
LSPRTGGPTAAITRRIHTFPVAGVLAVTPLVIAMGLSAASSRDAR